MWHDEHRIALYNNAYIHHDVNVENYDIGGWTCIRDNNDPPGTHRIMSSAEYDRRRVDGGYRWTFLWTQLPFALSPAPVLWCAILLLGGMAAHQRGLLP